MKFNYLFLLIGICFLLRANIDSGSLDSSFGKNGIISDAFFNINNTPRVVIMQPDRKILIGELTNEDF